MLKLNRVGFVQRKRSALIFAVALATMAVTSSARAVLLSDLIGFSSSINAGNLVFSDFSYLSTGDMPADTKINIVPYFDGTDWGIKIQGAFHDLPGGGASDALIEFKTSVNNPSLSITKVTLAGNPAVVGGTGVLSVVETFIPENTDDSLTIYSLVPGSSKFIDSATFSGSGYQTLHVQKDILASSGSLGGGVPQISFITQTYHVVPEPTSLALCGLAVLGMATPIARRAIRAKKQS